MTLYQKPPFTIYTVTHTGRTPLNGPPRFSCLAQSEEP